MKAISGAALEYVIASNVATIQLSVLASYLVPILVTSVIVCVVTAFMCIILSKKWYGEDWFEVAMGTYGQCTGTSLNQGSRSQRRYPGGGERFRLLYPWFLLAAAL